MVHPWLISGEQPDPEAPLYPSPRRLKVDAGTSHTDVQQLLPV